MPQVYRVHGARRARPCGQVPASLLVADAPPQQLAIELRAPAKRQAERPLAEQADGEVPVRGMRKAYDHGLAGAARAHDAVIEEQALRREQSVDGGEVERQLVAHPRVKKGKLPVGLVANRLKRIEGQVRGVQRMVEEDRYCVDVLLQVSLDPPDPRAARDDVDRALSLGGMWLSLQAGENRPR